MRLTSGTGCAALESIYEGSAAALFTFVCYSSSLDVSSSIFPVFCFFSFSFSFFFSFLDSFDSFGLLASVAYVSSLAAR